MDMGQLGRILLLVGISIVVVGVILIVAASSGFLQNLFNSGTIRIEGSNITCLVPIVASILISVVLTVVLNVVIRLLNK